jgi:hypothetical protein
MNRTAARLLAIVSALVLAAAPAAAQVIRGTVVDSASGKPVAGAHVRVSVATGTTVGDTATGKDGLFTFHLPAAGDYVLRVSRPGYSARTTEPFTVDTKFVAAVELRLVSSPVALDTLTVVAQEVAVERQIPFLVDAGFYDRRRKGIGHFLTRADLDQHPSDKLTNSFVGISGVHVVCAGYNLPAGACDVQAPGATTQLVGDVCKPSVVLDGVVLRSVGGGVSAAEVPAEAPAQSLWWTNYSTLLTWRPWRSTPARPACRFSSGGT